MYSKNRKIKQKSLTLLYIVLKKILKIAEFFQLDYQSVSI